MPTGIEGRNAFGQVFSETSYAGNFLGSFSTNGQKTGTYQDVLLVGKRLVSFAPQNSSDYGGPKVTLNSTNGVMTWEYVVQVSGDRTAPPIPNEVVFYGGY